MIRVSDFIIKYLEQQGVTDIFLVTGGGSIVLCDSLFDSKLIKYHPCHNEQAVTMAAEGYARAAGGVGVACVTTGPGCTNAITGVAGAWADSVPILVISGQVFLKQTLGGTGLRQYGVQEINIVDIVKPITKYAHMIDDPATVKYCLQKAFYLSRNGRPGPVWLDIPADVQAAMVDPDVMRDFEPPEISQESELALRNKVSHIVERLHKSRRPIIHVGQGVKISGAVAEFLKLVGSVKVPFVTARNANDIVDSSHELFVGRPGTYAHRGANFAVQNADFYLIIGSRMTFTQTGYNSHDYARRAFRVMVDIDAAELNKPSLKLDLRVHTDALSFIKELERQIYGMKFNFLNWALLCANWKNKYPVLTQAHIDQKGSVSSYYFVDQLSEVADKDDVVVTDMGFSFQCTHQGFKIKQGQKLFTNSGFAPMGWGLPAAIGAFLATKRRTLCLVGDGGFMMNPQELAVVMHARMPIKIFLFNNGGYVTQKQSQQAGFNNRLIGSTPETGVSFPSFEKLAGSFDIPYFKIADHYGIAEKLVNIISFSGPTFCELIMDQDEVQGPRCINRVGADGKKTQTPIEDMFPFLDIGEIQSNMLPLDS